MDDSVTQLTQRQFEWLSQLPWLLLFVVTLVLNIIALHVVRKYREQYE